MKKISMSYAEYLSDLREAEVLGRKEGIRRCLEEVLYIIKESNVVALYDLEFDEDYHKELVFSVFDAVNPGSREGYEAGEAVHTGEVI